LQIFRTEFYKCFFNENFSRRGSPVTTRFEGVKSIFDFRLT